MNNTRKIQKLIKNINMIFKKGYMPSREKETYSELHAKSVNCFGHACFNLSNSDLEKMDSSMPELKDFFRNFGCGMSNYFKVAQERIREVGLRIQRSSIVEKIEKNQWKIAYYTMYDEFKGSDVHFMIQGKDGKWASKLGASSSVEVYDKLPKSFKNDYSLVGVYKITNPYLENNKEEEMEM